MHKDKVNGIDFKLIIMSVIFLGICLVVPVWQSSVSASLTYKITQVDSNISAMTKQTTELRARIDELTDPQSNMRMAMVLGEAANVASNI